MGKIMKNIATMALKPGMEIAADIYNYRNELVFTAGTKVDANVIRKLNLYSVVVVTVMEELDYATTYFEKTRLSPGFIRFSEAYDKVMPVYKGMMIHFTTNRVPIVMKQLMKIYHDIADQVEDQIKILDYLYNMLPSEDDMTHAHCLNSALIAGVFARWLNLSPENTDVLIQCGFCYDIGKLRLPNSLIWKPDKLTDVEFMKMKTHTLLGFELLKDLELDQHIIKATLMHHERCDGSGYPSRLKGSQIDMFAKLVAIIDSYEAMTSARIYRQSKHPFQVIASFEESGPDKYDERLLKPILLHIAEHMAGNSVLLSNGQQAEVARINPSAISRPIVKYPDGLLIDLSINESLEIQSIC